MDRYTKGSLWQDESSRGEDGLVDFYVMGDEWEFLKRDLPIHTRSNNIPTTYLIGVPTKEKPFNTEFLLVK